MLPTIFVSLLTFAFFLSGISNDVKNITHLTAFASLSLGLIFTTASVKEIKFPPHFALLLIFTAILHIYWPFAANRLPPFYYALLFTEGLTLWFIVYNLPANYIRNLQLIFLLPAVLYSLFYFVSAVLGLNLLVLSTRFFEADADLGHQQIGSLWVVGLAYLVGSRFSNANNVYEFVLGACALYFLFISKSRSAYAAIFAALAYIFNKKEIAKWLLYPSVIAIGILIVYVGLNRSLLLSRPYFLQSLLSFSSNPLGVGMGNFRTVSEHYYYNAEGYLSSFSSSAHNIFLEAISGVGVLAMPFLVWGYKVFTNLIRYAKPKNFGWISVFVVLSVLFNIDVAYSIPGMFWIWFIALGIVQRENEAT